MVLQTIFLHGLRGEYEWIFMFTEYEWGRTSFLEALKPYPTHTPSSCSVPTVWNQQVRTQCHHSLSPSYTDCTVLHTSASIGRFTEPLTLLYILTQTRTCLLLSLFLSLCPLSSDHRPICSHSKAAQIISHSAWSNSLRFTKPNNHVIPKRTKRSPSILPTSQPPGTPLPGGKPKPDGPEKTTPLRWQHFPFAVGFFFL